MRCVNPSQEDQPVLNQIQPGVLAPLAMNARYRRQQEIYRQNDPVEFCYHLLSGAARKFSIRPSGRRQIMDFLMPGDFFGFASAEQHVFTVDAIVEGTVVARYPRVQLRNLTESDPRFGRLIHKLTATEISRLQERILLLGRITALEKVGAFLLGMAERVSDGPDKLVLLMSRYDIADYLALSVETVSWSLTVLRQSAAIKLVGTRHVEIIDRRALEEADGGKPTAPRIGTDDIVCHACK